MSTDNKEVSFSSLKALDNWADRMTVSPSHKCVICGEKEFEDVEYMYNDEFWICPDCLDKLRKIIKAI